MNGLVNLKVLLSFGTLVQIICSIYQIKAFSKPVHLVYSDQIRTFWAPKNMLCKGTYERVSKSIGTHVERRGAIYYSFYYDMTLIHPLTDT